MIIDFIGIGISIICLFFWFYLGRRAIKIVKGEIKPTQETKTKVETN
jgi:hypothetical protein